MAKILLVDDDYDFVSGVKVVLESADYEVIPAYSRAEGMTLFEKEKPDLVVLDVMMDEPDDGFTMAQELKDKHPKAVILMLSSIGQVTGMNYDKDDEMVPVDAFESKPIMPDELLAKVKELLNN